MYPNIQFLKKDSRGYLDRYIQSDGDQRPRAIDTDT